MPGRQAQVDVLQARPVHGEPRQRRAVVQSPSGQLVQQLGRLVGLDDQAAVFDGSSPDRKVRRGVPPRKGEADPRAGQVAPAECGRRSLFDDLAGRDDGDPVGELLRLVHVVGGEQDRGAQGGQLPDDLPGAAPCGRVEAGRRLVEEQDPGVPDDAEGEIQPPLLPAGQRLDLALLLAGEADEPDHLADIARIGVVARVAGDRLAHGQVRFYRELLQHQADLLAQLPPGALVTRIEAGHHDLALVCLPVTLEDLQHRRLASAVRPEQGEDLPVPDGKAHSRHGLVGAIALPQVLYDDSVHGLLPGAC